MVTDAKDVLRGFCMSSSLKGLPKVLKAEDRLLRLLWVTGALAGVAVGLYQTVSILKVFFEYNTNTHVSMRASTQMTFPDVTVCKINPASTVGEEGNRTFDNYERNVEQVIKNADAEDRPFLGSIVGLFGFYRNVDIGHKLVKATLKDFLVYCKLLKSTGSTKCQAPEYTFLTPGFPVCLTFHQDAYKHEMNTWSAVFYLEDFEPESDTRFFKFPTAGYHTGLKVFLHSPGAYPNMGRPYPAGPGHETFLEISETLNKYLTTPYSNCNQGKYIFGSDLLYTYNNCLYNCGQLEFLKICGCLDPDTPIPKNVRSAKYCGYLHHDDPKETAWQLRCWEESVLPISKQCNEKCKQPCHSHRFESQLSSIEWPHVSRHLAFYSTFIKDNRIYGDRFQWYSNISALMATDKKKAYEMLRGTDLLSRNFLKLTVYFGTDRLWSYAEVPDMSTSTMTGSLGGILNMWMGVTFITAIEIVELLIRLLRVRAPRHVESIEALPKALDAPTQAQKQNNN